MSSRLSRIAILLVGVLFLGRAATATTYYVDYATGNDSSSGTNKSTPWKHAPGMNGASGNAGSTSPAPGDKIIFKGCVTWPNAAFTWSIPSAGSAGNLIYYGVDKTWWDASVTGCSNSWNRPVFNFGNQSPTSTLYSYIRLNQSYVTIDNFEITNAACLPSPVNQSTTIFDWADNSETNVTVSNMYVHGWHNPVFSVGTGNTSAGSYTVSNFVPFSYSPAPSSAWVSGQLTGQVRLQTIPSYTNIQPGNNSPVLTGVAGSNPYNLTFTNTSGPANVSQTGVVIEVGGSYCNISGGGGGAQTNDVMLNNIIDGSDTAEIQLNPSGDCGASERNNNFCVGSATAGWRQPNIWRNNVIRFVSNAFIGSCQEWSGNLIEYIRLPTDPTGHTNAIECTDDAPVRNTTLFYNNVIRHLNNPNPNVPGGRWSIGAAPFWPEPKAGETAYIFNNVSYDAIQNKIISRGSDVGKLVVFNNSFACGNDTFGYSYQCSDSQAGDIFVNNLGVTTNSTPWGTGASLTSNILWSLAQASRAGYTTSQSLFALSPPNSNCSGVTPCGMSSGASNTAFCNALNSLGFVQAYQACVMDTTYGASFDLATHTLTVPARTSVAWQSPPAVGAFQNAGSTTKVQPPAGLITSVH